MEFRFTDEQQMIRDGYRKCAEGQRTTQFCGLLDAAVKAEREKVAAWMRSKSYATGHGDTIEGLLKELEWQVAEREREACLALVNQGTGEATSADALKILRMERDRISVAIRARGNHES